VAGGSGGLGSALLRSLGDEHDLVVFSREPHPQLSNPRARAVQWDGRQLGAWVAEIEGCDVVVNFSGAAVASGRWTAARKAALVASRVEPTAILVRAMEEARRAPRTFINTSAVGYYGDRGADLVTEDAPPGSDFLARLCVAWEAAAQRASEIGVRLVRPRVGIVLDQQGMLARLALPFRLGLGGSIGNGEQWISWVHIDDVVGMYRMAIEREEVAGPMNVTSPQPVTNRQLARALGRALRRPVWLSVPPFALRAVLGEFAHSVLTGQRAVPAVAERLGYQFRQSSIDGALHHTLDQVA